MRVLSKLVCLVYGHAYKVSSQQVDGKLTWNYNCLCCGKEKSDEA